ncbi:MAG: hypothetical protein J6P56_02845 [Bacteroidales bacterium]|nr:hypothetical protein [Bacteroidales bacterium]
MKKRISLYILIGLCTLVSCQKLRDKISPQGILMAGTAVEDRVKMSNQFYRSSLDNRVWLVAYDKYSFLVGADSHLTTDPGRMDEMLAIGLRDDDLFYAHLGDLADTKAEYYYTLDSLVKKAKERYVEKYYTQVNEYEWESNSLRDAMEDGSEAPYHFTYDEITYPFFPVVGNHDITHNGWALWSNIFHSSFYEIDVIVLLEDETFAFDHLIFLDSASGTLGQTQIELINQGVLDGKYLYDQGYRYTFVFSHTNIFRPQFFEFASTFTREETYFLLDQFEKWNVTGVFCGHVHTWDERNFNGVHYLTLDTMCEKNNPEPGDYLIRVNVGNNNLGWEPVRMNYTPKKK